MLGNDQCLPGSVGTGVNLMVGGFDRLHAQVVDYPECYGENWSALALHAQLLIILNAMAKTGVPWRPDMAERT